jgi:phage head maturation protease
VVCDLPDTSYARDLAELCQRGDLNQVSAAFWVLSSRYESGPRSSSNKTRIIESAVLREISAVAWACYETTSAIISKVDSDMAELAALAGPDSSYARYLQFKNDLAALDKANAELQRFAK